jgi:hypothetical protein
MRRVECPEPDFSSLVGFHPCADANKKKSYEDRPSAIFSN